MANRPKLLSLPEFEPLTTDDVMLQPRVVANTDPHAPPPDVHQLQVDVINVFEGRVELDTFGEEYQAKMKNYYRFKGVPHLSSTGVVAKRTRSTLDLV